MKKIEMPDWNSFILVNASFQSLEDRHLSVNWKGCKDWFKENIEGKLLVDKSDLVEVFSYKYTDDSNGNWSEKYDLLEDTHKAYLIKSSIEPIKKESLKDVVSEILEFTKINDLGDNYIDRFDLERLERALKVENDRV